MRPAYTTVIVEDEPTVADALSRLLEQCGHPVLGVASSADEALPMVAELEPDVVLLDIQLGGSDGLDLARRLMARCPRPIIVCTAHADPALFLEAGEAGVSAYLVKPFRLTELMAAIAVSHARFAHWHCDQPKHAFIRQTAENAAYRKR
jgi:CheY-like chemotaxis protein